MLVKLTPDIGRAAVDEDKAQSLRRKVKERNERKRAYPTKLFSFHYLTHNFTGFLLLGVKTPR